MTTNERQGIRQFFRDAPAVEGEPAGIGARVTARIADSLGMFAIAVIGHIVLRASLPDSVYHPDGGPQLGDALNSGDALYIVLLLTLELAYEVVPTAIWGMTLGKWYVRIRVVRAGSIEPPGLRGSGLRWLAFNLGFIAAVGDVFEAAAVIWAILLLVSIVRASDRRGLHDRIAGTAVVWGPASD